MYLFSQFEVCMCSFSLSCALVLSVWVVHLFSQLSCTQFELCTFSTCLSCMLNFSLSLSCAHFLSVWVMHLFSPFELFSQFELCTCSICLSCSLSLSCSFSLSCSLNLSCVLVLLVVICYNQLGLQFGIVANAISQCTTIKLTIASNCLGNLTTPIQY